MDTLSPERQAAPTDPSFTPAAPSSRVDLYGGIHKALRLMMARTLTLVGATDPDDADEVAATLRQVAQLLDLCGLHLKAENEFVHPALERAQPGSAGRIADLRDLRDLAGLAADSRGTPRWAALGCAGPRAGTVRRREPAAHAGCWRRLKFDPLERIVPTEN